MKVFVTVWIVDGMNHVLLTEPGHNTGNKQRWKRGRNSAWHFVGTMLSCPWCYDCRRSFGLIVCVPLPLPYFYKLLCSNRISPFLAFMIQFHVHILFFLHYVNCLSVAYCVYWNVRWFLIGNLPKILILCLNESGYTTSYACWWTNSFHVRQG